MKRWLGLALAGVGVCLLLALSGSDVVRGVDSHPRIGWGRSVGPWGAPASASPTAAPAARSSGPTQARVGSPESPAAHLVLSTERDVSPLDSRGPPGKVQEPLVICKAAGKGDSPEQRGRTLPPGGHAPGPGTTPKRGILQQPLASPRLR
jgi:hypothetical protein